MKSVPAVEYELNDDVFKNALEMRKKGNINISENDIDRAHRIGNPYVDKL